MSEATLLRHGERRVRLKWHQLRQAPGDPAHDRANLERGIALGASLEVDAVLSRDGHLVCLHDEELAAETTGSGWVGDHDRVAIEALRQVDGAGRAGASPPLFLDQVVAALSAAPADWPGHLQVDLKVPVARLDDGAVARFRDLIAPIAGHVVLAGTEWRSVTALGGGVPGLRLGFDPLAIHQAAPPASAAEFEALGAYTLAHAPGAVIYYLHIPTVLRGLDLEVDLVAMVKQDGAEVDAWRIEPGHPDATPRLARLLDAGIDQVTTDSPLAWAAGWDAAPARSSTPRADIRP